jgi:hypothetical protein
MSAQKITRIAAIAFVAGCAVLTPALSIGVPSVSASSERTRKLHLTKECSEYFGAAGDWCTVTVSNLRRLPVGSRVLYSQAMGVPAGLLDSNVVLDAGDGSRAVGRCTLDLATQLGLCTFSDGTGRLAGFQARVDVTCPGDGIVCDLDGTYSFTPSAIDRHNGE